MKATTRTLVFLVAALGSASAFVGSKIASRPSLLSRRLAAGKPPSGDEKEIDVATKASWYAVEAFGKIFGNKGETDAPLTTTRTSPPRSVAETMARIEKDNEKEYFLSGDVDKLIYDDNCEFADPFVSFRGRDRFIENLENLSSVITAYSAKLLSYEADDESVQTKFMVKLELNLPWKPVLAWPWGVRCEIDPATCLIVLHQESWDIDPIEVRKRHSYRQCRDASPHTNLHFYFDGSV
jgi:hypothetical protein